MRAKKNPPSKAFTAGLAMRKKVLGEDYVERSFKNPDDFSMPFQELATEFAWGSVWTRPGLSLRDRSLRVAGAVYCAAIVPTRSVDSPTRCDYATA